MTNIWNNRNWEPMLLKETDKPFDSKDYLFEIKFDGIRAIIFADKNEVKIQSRNKKDLTFLFPELQNISRLVTKKVIFDGEIVAFENNKDSFSKIQKRIHLKNPKSIIREAKNNPISFMVFDILYENKDLTNLPLFERKKYLNKYADDDFFIKTKVIKEKGIALFESIKKLNLEGIIAKEKEGKYFINKRTDEFIKIKNIKRDEFLVGGYEKKKNNMLSLALGEYIDGKFHFVGKASISSKRKIYNDVLQAKCTKNYFDDFNEDIYFIKPVISCFVKYLERTPNNHLRHPVLKDY